MGACRGLSVKTTRAGICGHRPKGCALTWGDGSGLWTVPPRIRVLVPGPSEGTLVWAAPRQPLVWSLDEGDFLFQDKSEALSGMNIQILQLRGWSEEGKREERLSHQLLHPARE